jgi:hypothetical protein
LRTTHRQTRSIGVGAFWAVFTISNRWLNLEFCSTCGTTVSWTAEFFPSARGISEGTLDDPNWIRPEAQYFTRSAVHWMAFSADVPAFETLPQIDVAAFVAENFPPHVSSERNS